MKRRVCLRWTLRVGAGLALAAALVGCQRLGYYAQAIHGQCQIVHRQRPIASVLADPAAPAPLKEQLRLVLKIREYAERELKLPCHGHYLKYADLGRPFVVWNVHAAPEFSLEAKTWWYPVVGSLEYQGYFNEERARRYAARLRKAGWDVHVGGVEAYSTLGWFRDPVLNTFISSNEADLAELLFHELAHQRVFVNGDTEFNEAFATAVAEEGLRRWMDVRGDAAAHERYRAAVERRQRFVQLVTAARERLERLYGEAGSVPSTGADAEALRRRKAEILGELRREYQAARTQWGGHAEYDGWFEQPLNNAQLNTIDAYYKWVPGFVRLLQAAGGDWDKFYREVKSLGKLKKEERHRRLQRLQ